ncbi:hypothetical protein JCM10908_001095 [Rhodotorula pacifica]|uniref:uncharacterized protein n=1 Tax=Rhodotorula pacifica TaxID=1495444 RepID=UPI003179D20E
MSRVLLWTTFALAPVSAYALAPAAPPAMSAVALAAMTIFSLQTISKSHAPRAEKAVSFMLVWLALGVGTATSLVLSNSTLSSTFSSGLDIIAALFLFTLVTTAVPLAGLVLLIASTPSEKASSATAIGLSGLIFALAGSIYEHISGIGRIGWWTRALTPGRTSPLYDLGERIGGPVLVDWVVGACALAIAQVAWRYLSAAVSVRDGLGASVDLLQHEEDEETVGGPALQPALDTISTTARPSLRKPAYFLLLIGLLVLAAPVLSVSDLVLAHPAPNDRSYVYPPVQVGCVSPPLRDKQPLSAEDWIKETTVLAGRGVKVLSWSEGAVRLDKGAKHEPDGDEHEPQLAFDEQELSLLRRVGKICDMYKVYVLAAYSAEHTDNSPNIVFTTTKHHPVPFVESYSHAVRALPQLGSIAGWLPLAQVTLPHPPHTPSPHLTPLQSLSISAAICQDAAYPSLLSSLARVDSSQDRTAQLILNPSATPPSLPGFGALSLAQARARAIEQGAFVLRCDEPAVAATSSSGSVLIDPRGQVRVWTGSDSSSGSWEAAIRPEEASTHGRATFWTWLGGTGAEAVLSAEARFLLLLAAAVLLVRIVEGGEARHYIGETDWRQAIGRYREQARMGLQQMRIRLSRTGNGDGPGGSNGDRGTERERLIEVD